MVERPPVHVEVPGLRKLRRDLRAMGDDLADLRAASTEAAGIVADAASDRAPHLSGKLAASVRASNTTTGARVAAGGPTVPYAGPIHWGWPAHNIAPHPFIPDAAEATEDRWVGVYVSHLERAVAKVAGRHY